MGQVTTITITNAPELSAEQLGEIASNHVNDSCAWTEDDGTHRVEGHSKWTPDTFISDVLSLTSDLPAAGATVNEEWDTRDADEPGQRITRYLGGTFLSQATQVTGLVPDDLPTAIADVRAALAMATEKTAWLLDGLDGTRA
ncbi:hypothetical protein [Microbacterium sp. ZOR0019]|uniref:hypothetical protein n=1 Tax=Microbacterium sp. ZOR0019 TaxID=1339233 RepID=UPI00064810EA|nr:hypothetical protein [Microbacterium sp. ZOR0019]